MSCEALDRLGNVFIFEGRDPSLLLRCIRWRGLRNLFVCIYADLERGRGLAIDDHLQWYRERRTSGRNEGRSLSGDGILEQRALGAEKVGDTLASLRTKQQSYWDCRGMKVVRGLDLYEDSGIFTASLRGV